MTGALTGLSTSQQSAYDLLAKIFRAYGLPDSPDIIDAIKEGAIAGDSADLIQARLEQTDSWKLRFKGNEIRKQKGLNVLSVDQYLAQEDTYQQVLRNAGLPTGFFDQHDDFTNFIGNNISAAELQDRVNLAGDIINREDPAVVAALAARGIDKGMLLAHALDAERTAPLIKREQNSILIGAAANRSGLGVSQSQADLLAERGIGESQAIQGFGQINDFLNPTQKLGDIYGVDYTTEDAIGEVFGADSGDKRKRLARNEKSAFAGQSNYGVARRDSSGAF